MAHKINISKKISFRVWNCTGLQLKMSPPKQVTTTLVLCFAIVIPNVVVSQHQPYFFDYHQQQQPQYQQNPYQPFTNAPPGTYYTPTYESHSPGGGGHHAGSPELLGNYFSNGFSPAPTSPASNNLVTYPTQVTTLDGSRHHLSHQSYQPVGNSLVQQTPTVPTTTTTNAFRPSPLINHHTHIVNGLPQRQFFGNNYEFFRDRHGLPTFSPFTHQNTLQTVPSPSPTPALVSTSAAPSPSSASPSASPSKASESKQSGAVKPLPLDLPSSPSPPTTQSTFLSRFPFNGPSTFSPATNQQQNYRQVASATTPAPRFAAAQPTTASPSNIGVSPSFQFSQFFPETDTINSNQLSRQPLFQEDEDEEEDDDNYTLNNNGNTNYYSTQARQVSQQRPQQQVFASHSATSSPAQSYKSGQQTSYNTGGTINNGLNFQAKDEPAPIRIHNTTPIRIVFNYEQAAQALEENPGVRVVIAQTEKNNLTQDEFSTTQRPYYAPVPASVSATTPRSATSPATYQATSTARPNNYGTYRPAVPSTYRPAVSSTYRPTVSSTPPPQRSSPTPRFQYQPVNVPYNTQTAQDEGTTAAALENLALELEGRFAGTGRPSPVSQQPIYETVATLATEPTPTEDPLISYKRGGKKYVAIPSGGDKVYKAQEPRVVVNDLANIFVQTVQPGGHFTPTPPSTFPRQSFRDFDQVEEVGQEVEDLSDEIAHLSQQIQQQEFQTTTRATTTTTTSRPPVRSSPHPRTRPTVTPRLLRITTYRPPFTFPSTFKSTTTPTPPTSPQVEEETEETLPEVNNQLSSEPPALTARKQPQRYYYNNRQRDGLSGAHQRYEYNGVENQSASPQPDEEQSQPQERPQQKVIRRRPRPRGRLIAGSPPRAVQVNGGPGLGPVVGPDGFPAPFLGPGIPFSAGPGGALGPVPPGAHLPGGPVFRVGPRGRLLRRKTRPRAQLQGQQPSLAPSEAPSASPSLAPTPSSPSAFPEIASVAPNFVSSGPSQLPPLSPYNPNPFIPQEVPLVTTFRPGAQNVLLQQSLVDQEEERKQERPSTFRSRFRFQPSTTTSTAVEDEEEGEGASNQYESEEEAPVSQRRRFSTTSTTTEKPVEKAVISDRANILQRQIRFNRNRKNQKNNRES